MLTEKKGGGGGEGGRSCGDMVISHLSEICINLLAGYWENVFYGWTAGDPRHAISLLTQLRASNLWVYKKVVTFTENTFTNSQRTPADQEIALRIQPSRAKKTCDAYNYHVEWTLFLVLLHFYLRLSAVAPQVVFIYLSYYNPSKTFTRS